MFCLGKIAFSSKSVTGSASAWNELHNVRFTLSTEKIVKLFDRLCNLLELRQVGSREAVQKCGAEMRCVMWRPSSGHFGLWEAISVCCVNFDAASRSVTRCGGAWVRHRKLSRFHDCARQKWRGHREARPFITYWNHWYIFTIGLYGLFLLIKKEKKEYILQCVIGIAVWSFRKMFYPNRRGQEAKSNVSAPRLRPPLAQRKKVSTPPVILRTALNVLPWQIGKKYFENFTL